MDFARPDTVLGDFNDRTFTHIAFEHWPLLDDAVLREIAPQLSPEQWAIALHDVSANVRDQILRRFTREIAEAIQAATAKLPFVRPCDATAIHRQVGDLLRQMAQEGKVDPSFAVTSRLFRQGNEFFVTTDNREGHLETFRVKYVFGVRPLQQYLVEFPDGRVQCLPMAWDVVGKSWFHLYPKEPIPHDDILHWTRPLQNWNYMCADCHSTDLQRNYNLHEDRYETTWSEIDVSCEACHGPGSLHVELAEAWSFFWDRRHGYGLPRLKGEDSRPEIDTCAPCHARRNQIYPGFRPGNHFLDHYVPELLDSDLYYADGQILDENYEYGSFLQSLMYRKGVRCSDCHDPHSLRMKTDPPGQPRPAVPDNRVCNQCHLPSKYDTPRHHFHPDLSKPGTRCVDCHMPVTTYMVVDPRRDHSLRIPRPDLTVSLGIPNACNLCHNDVSKGETPEWALEWVRKWYAEKAEPVHFAYAFAQAREGKPEAIQELLATLRRADHAGIVRASALALLARFAQPSSRSAEAVAMLLESLEDSEPLVRWVAVRSLTEHDPDQLVRRLAPRLSDPIRAVRLEAARQLSGLPASAFGRAQWRKLQEVLEEYFEGQWALSDQPAAHLNRAVILTNLGRLAEAEDAYRMALRIDATFIPARNNLAILYDQMGRKSEAEHELRKVVELAPDFAEGWYSLGLLIAENPQRLEEAAQCLTRATQLAPEGARIHYNLGLALQRLKRMAEAEKALKTAFQLAPNDLDIRRALGALYLELGESGKAREFVIPPR